MSANHYTPPPARNGAASRVVPLGLGRFGSSPVLELVDRGSKVLALDSRDHLVQQFADSATHAAGIDTTDPEALRQLDVPDFGGA